MASRAKIVTKIKSRANSKVIFDYLSGKKKILKIGPLLDFYGFLEQKRGKSKNGPIFTFNTAIESYGNTDYGCFIHFEKKSKMTILEPKKEKKYF